MVVQHNLTAMNSNRMLGLTTTSQAKSTEKLSSGYKINRAADDAAGLSISEKMRKQIRGLTQASLNAEDGISAVQTAEGALNEVQDMLQRMNELAVKAANGTNSEDDRSYIQNEIDQLVTEIDRVSTTTKFNESYLLKGVNETTGEPAELTYATATENLADIGTVNDEGVMELAIDAVDAGDVDVTGTVANTNFTGKSVTLGDATYYVVEAVEKADEDVDDLGSISDVIDAVNDTATEDAPVKAFGSMEELLAAVKSDFDLKGDMKSITATKNANDEDVIEVTTFADLNDSLNFSLHVGADSDDDNKIDVDIMMMSARGLGINGLRVDGSDDTNATNAIDTIANAIQQVSTQRSALGAVQNRLEHTIANLDNVVENTTAAESQIRDTDMATEMVRYSNNNILAQAGQSMLAQANQSNQGVLSLLQ